MPLQGLERSGMRRESSEEANFVAGNLVVAHGSGSWPRFPQFDSQIFRDYADKCVDISEATV